MSTAPSSSSGNAPKTSGAAARAWWRGLSARDRRMALVGGAVLVLFVLWMLALQPALSTLRNAPAEMDVLEVQWQTMTRLAVESVELRSTPPVSPEQAAAALTAASTRLGEKGRLVLQGDRATLTLNGVGTGALRDWLAEARSGARARPIEANLVRAAQGYSGTLILAIGAAP